MCFNATASFTAAGVLATIGIVNIIQSRHHPTYLFMAIIPLCFAFQQLCEGFVWQGFAHNNAMLIYICSLGFLFFASFIWPILVPLSVVFIERNKMRRRYLWYLTSCGFLLACYLYLPLILGFYKLHVAIVHDSIGYTINRFIDSNVHYLFYVAITAGSYFITTHFRIHILGCLMVISVVLAKLYYSYAFISVWCFFTALISLNITWYLYFELKAQGQSQ